MKEIIFKNGQCFLAMDEALGGFPTPWSALQAAATLGMDEEGQNRSFDRDGRMHVKTSNISKANICDYFGREIPKADELGLDPKKKYRMLRDPEELKKGAGSFNNLPILAQHVPVTAEDPNPHLIIGTTGTDAAYEHPYLTNSTAYWSGGAVNAINTEAMKDLSSAYHFRADMTPGEYEGEAYDGVMRDIVGNHVALVRKGRAGDDVVVGDCQPEELLMSKKVLSRTALFAAGASAALIASKLAMDANPVDTSELFADVTFKNFTEQKPIIATRLRQALTGVKLAQDASVEDIVKLVDALEKPEVMEGADADPESGAPLDAAMLKEAMKDPGAMDEEETEKKKRDFLSEKLGADGMAAYDAICGLKPAIDAAPVVGKPAEATITKPAMDEAIKDALATQAKNFKGIREAEIAIEPYVGKLSLAFDSAPAVYTKALEMLGVDTKGKHPDALPAILAAQPKPGAKPAPRLAMDAVPTKDFTDRFPGASRIGVA